MTVRRLLAHLLAMAACLVLPLGLVSGWLDLVVTDTDQYVEKVGPIAEHEEVEQATEDWISAFVARTIDEVSPVPIASLGQGLIDAAVAQVVASPDFEPAWRAGNRTMHPQIIAVLEGDTRGVTTEDGVIGFELGPLLEEVMEGGSFPGVDLSAFDTTIPLLRSQDLRDAQDAYAVADAAGLWVLGVAVGLMVLALLMAPSRRAVLGTLSYGSIATLLLLVASLFWVRDQAVESALTPVDGALVGAMWDVLAADLFKVIGALLVAALVIVLGRLLFRPRRS